MSEKQLIYVNTSKPKQWLTVEAFKRYQGKVDFVVEHVLPHDDTMPEGFNEAYVLQNKVGYRYRTYVQDGVEAREKIRLLDSMPEPPYFTWRQYAPRRFSEPV